MNSNTKAQRYLLDNKVFPLSKKGIYERWGVEGKTGVWTVVYDHTKNRYSCNCKNIRPIECSHIKAVRIKRDI